MTILLVSSFKRLHLQLIIYEFNWYYTFRYITSSLNFVAGQFFKIGWKMVMLGDETWLKLFPGSFTRRDGVHSFFVSLQCHIFILCEDGDTSITS